MKIEHIRTLLLLVLFLNSCAIGYKKLSIKNLDRDLRKKQNELVHFLDLPDSIADTLASEYNRYWENNKGLKNVEYHLTDFITFDSNIVAEHIKYQDFNSDKLRLPFGYFFKFGTSKFFIPYGENQGVRNPFIYLDGYIYFYGKNADSQSTTIHDLNHPDYYKIDFKNRLYWKIPL